MARRKVKNEEESPWGQCLIRPVPNGRRRSAFSLGRKTQKFSDTNQKSKLRRPFGTGLVRHCPQGLFSPFFTFLRAIFFHPFRLSLAPTICPWVSEDDGEGTQVLKLYKLVPLEPSHGRRVRRGGTQVLKLYKLVPRDRTLLSRCSAPSKEYPLWHCVPLVR